MSTCGTCNGCALWEPGEGYFCAETDGYCNQPQRWSRSLNEIRVPDAGAAGHGEPGAPARVRTGPLFGCIHFVKKDAQ